MDSVDWGEPVSPVSDEAEHFEGIEDLNEESCE